jgi:DNA modification methylase
MWTNIFKRKSAKIYRHLWSGLLRAGDRKLELKDRVHPTQKPVGLLSEIIKDYTEKNHIVLDPYLGSGSTLIACEQTDRICYGMELDPAYIDVIIERWENYTGKKAKKL